MIEKFELMAKLRRELLHMMLHQNPKQMLYDIIFNKMTPSDWAYQCCRLGIDNDK